MHRWSTVTEGAVLESCPTSQLRQYLKVVVRLLEDANRAGLPLLDNLYVVVVVVVENEPELTPVHALPAGLLREREHHPVHGVLHLLSGGLVLIHRRLFVRDDLLPDPVVYHLTHVHQDDHRHYCHGRVRESLTPERVVAEDLLPCGDQQHRDEEYEDNQSPPADDLHPGDRPDH